MIRIGQIGVGNWGKNLLRNFTGHPETELVAISDTSQYVMDNMARRYPQAELYPDAQKLIRESGTEAIVIATESSTHFRFAFEALEQGKHVFVEKPMALVPEEAERLAELASLRGLVLMVGHLLMYHPAYLKAKELMDTGELGDIQYMYSTRVNLGVVRHRGRSIPDDSFSQPSHGARSRKLAGSAQGTAANRGRFPQDGGRGRHGGQRKSARLR
jgi:predicted dehydrogenase